MSEIKLNLGCGDVELDGYRNMDIKRGPGEGAYPLLIDDGSVDEIRASHLLEHFPMRDTLPVLAEWYRAIKPGGRIKIAVPDFDVIAKSYLDGDKINVTGYLMGGQTDENDYHKNLFSFESLKAQLEHVGFEKVNRWLSNGDGDCSSLPISLNLMGYKPKAVTEAKDGLTTCKVDCRKIGAVISMPRLAFTANMFCVIRGMLPLGIEVEQGSGVFWGQVLSRIMQKQIDAGKEYILTMDYDTWFTDKHVLMLAALMEKFPEADAIFPLQVKRESDGIMAGRRMPEGVKKMEVALSEFQSALTPMTTGHFGLTMIRVSAIKKLKKPWFLAVPNKNGEWFDDRLDEDIYFWNKAHDQGFKSFLATGVSIGHVQQMCTFPGRIEDACKPVHVSMHDLDNGNIPEHCIPQLINTKKVGG